MDNKKYPCPVCKATGVALFGVDKSRLRFGTDAKNKKQKMHPAVAAAYACAKCIDAADLDRGVLFRAPSFDLTSTRHDAIK